MGLSRSRPRYSIHHKAPTAAKDITAMKSASASRMFNVVCTAGGRSNKRRGGCGVGVGVGVKVGLGVKVIVTCGCGGGCVCVSSNGAFAPDCPLVGVGLGEGVGVLVGG